MATPLSLKLVDDMCFIRLGRSSFFRLMSLIVRAYIYLIVIYLVLRPRKIMKADAYIESLFRTFDNVCCRKLITTVVKLRPTTESNIWALRFFLVFYVAYLSLILTFYSFLGTPMS